ncbi:MAG: MFS transporter [Thermoanaerobaculia bacterium]|nr:MFS transporter [Thermoanaerobaculia bacterium]
MTGHAALTFAREAQIVVIGWQVFAITRDPLSLGLIGLAEAIPLLGFALYAGHLADVMPRRPLAITGAAGMTLSSILLLVVTLQPDLLASYGIWSIYGLVFLGGIGRSFVRPAVSALSAEVIPRELYPSAVAWRSSVWHLAAIAGPAAGGLIYGFAGAKAAYITVVALMLVSLLGFVFVRHSVRPVPPEEQPLVESIMSGVRFVWRDPVLLGAMSLDLFSVLFGGATALLPIFAVILGAGPEGLGVLRAAPAVGSIAVGILMAHRAPSRRAGGVLLTCVALFGVFMISFALSRNFVLSFLLLLASGVVDGVSVVIRALLLQMRAPGHLLGRVSSVNQMFIGASNEIGAFESGVAARLMGTVPSVVFGGCMTLLVVAVTAWKVPQLRRLRDLHTS